MKGKMSECVMIIYYICKVCGGQTIYLEKCVWCGNKEFEVKERKVEKSDIFNKRGRGTHFGKGVNEFCLEV